MPQSYNSLTYDRESSRNGMEVLQVWDEEGGGGMGGEVDEANRNKVFSPSFIELC